MSARSPTVSFRAVASIVSFAQARAPGARERLEHHVLGRPLGDDPDDRFPAEMFPLLLREAARITEDPAFGLHLGKAGDLRRFGVLYYTASASHDLRAAFGRVSQFLALWNEGMEIRLASRGDDAWLEFHPRGIKVARDDEGLRHYFELATATLMNAGGTFVGQAFQPRHVEFFTAPPADPGERERIYQTRLIFGAPITRIVFDAAALELPTATAEPLLADILTQHAEELLARLGATTSWSGRVREDIVKALRGGTADLASVAKGLGMSPRTLQRRLGEEDTTFARLLDEVRYEVASGYLRDPRLSLGEIAYLLGFAELSAFYSAFKRWTGTTPAEFRKAQRQPMRASADAG